MMEQEISHWQSLAIGSTREASGAAVFLKHLNALNSSYQSLAQLAIRDILNDGLLDNVDVQLNELWRKDEAFPEIRMRGLFDIFENRIAHRIQSPDVADIIWRDDFREAEEGIADSISVCERWMKICRFLTEEHWTESTRHVWKSGPVRPDLTEKIQARLQKILLIRTLVDDAENLTGSLTKPSPLEVFQHNQKASLDVGGDGDGVWNAAVTKFEQRMHRYEDAVIERMKSRFQDNTSNPLHALAEFRKCGKLTALPRVKKALTTERDFLLTHVGAVVSKHESEFEKGNETLYENQSKTISRMIWHRQLFLKVEELDTGLSDSLSDLPKFNVFYKRLAALKDGLKDRLHNVFDGWCTEVTGVMKNPKGELSLDVAGRLMETDKTTGRLVVNFSNRLAVLISEVRWLRSVGYAVPGDIIDRSNLAKKFYDSAIVLMQVAHFYNTVDQQMVPCQRPMMIESARRFQNVIRGGKGGVSGGSEIKWSDTKRLEAYVTGVQEATSALTQENRRLRSLHQKVVSFVVQMTSTDLIQKVGVWQKLLNEIHKIVASVAVDAQRYPPENLLSWQVHIDHQICKALEIQLRRSLLSLADTLPEQNVEIVYRNQALQLRPSPEQLRELQSQQLEKLFGVLTTLKPLCDISQKRGLFRQVVNKCHMEVGAAQRNLEDMLKKLEECIDDYKPYVVLGGVDVPALVRSRVDGLQDWDRELKALSHRRRLVDQLPFQIKVEKMTIGLNSLRTAIDGLIQDATDALLNTLRQSIAEEVKSASDFVAEASAVLAARPSSTEELTALSMNYLQLVKQCEEMRPRLTSTQEKNALLKTATGRGADRLDATLQTWGGIVELLEDHGSVMKDQTAALRGQVEKDVGKLLSEIEKFAARWQQARPSMSHLDTLDIFGFRQITASISTRREELQELLKRREALKLSCEQLGIPMEDDSTVTDLVQELDAGQGSWKEIIEFSQQLDEFAQEDWLTFRNKLYKFEDFLKNWTVQLQPVIPTAFTIRLQKEIARFRGVLAGLKLCRGDAFSDEHWGEMFNILQLRNTNLEKLTVGDLLKFGDSIMSNADALKDLANRAQAEVSIREALRELEIWGATAAFHTTNYHDSADNVVTIVKDWTELLSSVGEKQRLIQSTKDSQHYGRFADRIALWEQRLLDLSFLLETLHQMQRKWVYLEPICARNTLPNEEGRFKRVDNDLRSVLKEIAKEPRLLSWMRPALKGILPGVLDQLQRCQKALNEFLESKRLAFPRFYFIGDEDLLEILGQSGNVKVLQAHLKKLFGGVHSVEFGSGNREIIAVKSPEGEVLRLKSHVNVTGSVEIWLAALSEELRRTLRLALKEALRAPFAGDATDAFPSQVVRLAEKIRFTKDVEFTLRSTPGAKQFTKLSSDQQDKLNQLTSLQHETNEEVKSASVKGLILDYIYRLEVLQTLTSGEVDDIGHWLWQKQLRFYTDSEAGVTIRMVDAEFQYSYEYQGCQPGLVYTALTDKCFLTLTQAMLMGLGGNPYGPAGTGKTESVKELAAQLGRQVLVFNCDEGIDPKSMGRIFIGLLKCGAWGCFDEFNRLDELTLSAISTQVLAIQAALKDSTKRLELLDRKIDINPDSGIFITLNPASKGYGGRVKLPDNLKQLFRPIAMTVPDAQRIAEVVLLSEGFQSAKSLGKKLTTLYGCARSLLTAQQHYDWGLRAVKSTVQMGGRAMAMQRARNGQQKNGLTESEESAILVQALRSNVFSKLTSMDQKRFTELLKDTFPGVGQDRGDTMELEEALIAAFENLELVVNESQVQKAVELHGQLAQRMGVVVVGPAGSGKTTIWKLLTAALAKLGKPIVYHVINPTAMPKTQLLGFVEESTREWTDGVLTHWAREVVKEASESNAWIVCDGDIDPDWIESLNSVLDDNRLLTLPSGERLRFPANVNFLFETNDLTAASPATVSRMGMIFLSSENVMLRTVVDAWIKRQPGQCQPALQDNAESILFGAITRARSWPGVGTGLSEVALCMNALSQLDNVVDRADFVARVLHCIGAVIPEADQDRFAVEVLGLAGYDVPDIQKPFNVYYNNESGMLKAQRLKELQKEYPESPLVGLDHLPYFPCISQQLIISRLIPWVQRGDSILLLGSSSSGKTKVLDQVYRKLDIRNVVSVQCSSLTSAHVLIGKLKQYCLSIPTATGRLMRPKGSDRLILYVKDLHVVKRDRWGHSQVEAILRQMISQGGFYDGNSDWVELSGVQIVATSSTDLRLVSDRMTSVMRVSFLSNPDAEDLQAIAAGYFRSLVAGGEKIKSHALWSQARNLDKLAGTLVSMFVKLQERCAQSGQRHYSITLRDLVQWIVGLKRYPSSDQSSGSSLLSAVVSEASRLFRDKLSTPSDLAFFEATVTTTMRKDWPNISTNGDELYCSNFDAGGSVDGAPLPAFGRELSKTTAALLHIAVQNSVKRINRENVGMEVSIHSELIREIMKLDHWLSQPSGSVLLLAPSGNGRRTATLIAAKLQQAVIVRPRIVRGYSNKSFKSDMKKVVDTVGVKCENTVFLLEDYQITDPVFLEMLVSMISGGGVDYPGLYNDEEREKLYGTLSDQIAQESYDGSAAAFLASRLKRNLHCVVTLDPADDRFASLSSRIPALANVFHVVWTNAVSDSTLITILQMLSVAGSPTENAPTSDAQESVQLAAALVHIHENSPPHLKSCARFIQFLRTFRSIKQIMTSENKRISQRLQAGLDHLNRARSDVLGLKKEAGQQQKAVTNKQEEANRAMEEIRESMSGANTQKEEVTLLRSDLEKEKIRLMEREQMIAGELQEVLPMLENAKVAVNKIKTSDLNEIKSLRAPPAVIHNILEGVLKLFGNKDTSWSGMRTFLSPTMKNDIINFDVDRVSKEHLRMTHQLIEKYPASFEEETAKRGSVAAAPLAAWVKACCKYAEVHEKIAPLAQEKRKLESIIEMNSKRVTNADKDLGKLGTRIDHLQARFQNLTEEAAVMKIELKKLTERLQVAEFLVEKLEGEHARWSTQLKSSADNSRNLQTNALLAAGFVTYLASSSEDERQEYMSQWLQHVKAPAFDVLEQLTTEKTRLEWRTEGLPADTLSVENAVILQHTTAPPLIIDPSGAVLPWLKLLLKNKSAEIVDQDDANFQSILEMAVRFGKALVVEIPDKVDGVLVPLLRGDIIKQGTRVQIEMGDKLIEYHPQFRLYLTTRNPALTLHPQVAGLVNVISFTATRAGLANQLLSLVIECKLPEVENRRRALVQEQESLKIKLAELEDSLLSELSNSQGNILENTELRQSLDNTKKSSETAEKNLLESQKIKETLDRDQAVFAVLAKKCCSIYFALQALPKLNPLYRFSLQSFIGIYRKAVETLAKDNKDTLQLFCARAFYDVIHLVYTHVLRAIFKKDRLTFVMLFVKFVRPELIKEEEWDYFLNSKVADGAGLTTASWIPADRQSAFSDLVRKIPVLKDTLQLEDSTIWKPFIGHPQCETAFPSALKVSPFQQVLIVATLRPDRTVNVLSGFGAKSLKLHDLATDASLKALLDESSAGTPILIVTSAGADPSLELAGLAREKGMGETFQQMAMGTSEDELAAEAIADAAKKGHWLCLKNLHLVPAFFSRVVKELKDAKPVSSFRLWLTTEGMDSIPPLLLESSLKCVYEAPPGIKQNLQSTLKESSETIKTVSASNSAAQRVILILFWFHAVAQERRNYLPQGWTKFYEFGTSDLNAAMRVIAKYAKASGKTEGAVGDFIRGLLHEVVYGGRVDSGVDDGILLSYIRNYFDETSLTKGELPKNAAGKFQPVFKSVGEFLEYVKNTLPEIDEPGVLGLPENIDGSRQRNEGIRIARDLHWLQELDVARVAAEKSEWSEKLSALLRIVAKAGEKSDRLVSGPDDASQTADPLQCFFLYEQQFGRDLLRTIEESITALLTQVKGTDTTLGKSHRTFSSLLSDETPAWWLGMWLGPREPSAYIRAVERLMVSCSDGLSRAKRKVFGTTPVDVKDLFHLDNFVSSLRHLASRETGTSMERLHFSNAWSTTGMKGISHAITITGIHLEGALFDGVTLKDVSYDSPSSSPVGPCTVAWLPEGAAANENPGNHVRLPVFSSASREEYLFHLSVPCDSDPSKWIRLGAAFLVNP